MTWHTNRTYRETAIVEGKRQGTVVKVIDPDSKAKKLRERANVLPDLLGLGLWCEDEAILNPDS